MRILAFGAHPDDIEVAMGGTIARYSTLGHKVTMAVVTIPNHHQQRRSEAEAAAQALGAELMILDVQLERVRHGRYLVTMMDEVYSEIQPDVVYTHWNKDSHQDHMVVAQATVSVTRENACSVYMYEQTIPGGVTPGAFRAQKYVDISDYIELKLRSVLAHKSQVQSNGDWWAYGIRGRAMYRGYQINCRFAECFEVVKEIWHIEDLRKGS